MIVISKNSTTRLIKGHRYEATELSGSNGEHARIRISGFG